MNAAINPATAAIIRVIGPPMAVTKSVNPVLSSVKTPAADLIILKAVTMPFMLVITVAITGTIVDNKLNAKNPAITLPTTGINFFINSSLFLIHSLICCNTGTT